MFFLILKRDKCFISFKHFFVDYRFASVLFKHIVTAFVYLSTDQVNLLYKGITGMDERLVIGLVGYVVAEVRILTDITSRLDTVVVFEENYLQTVNTLLIKQLINLILI